MISSPFFASASNVGLNLVVGILRKDLIKDKNSDLCPDLFDVCKRDGSNFVTRGPRWLQEQMDDLFM